MDKLQPQPISTNGGRNWWNPRLATRLPLFTTSSSHMRLSVSMLCRNEKLNSCPKRPYPDKHVNRADRKDRSGAAARAQLVRQCAEALAHAASVIEANCSLDARV